MFKQLVWTISTTFVLFFSLQLPLVQNLPLFSQQNAFAAEVKQAEISDQELEKFAQAWIEVINLDQQTRQEMVEVVEDQGFDVERFQAIAQAQQADTEPTPPLTSEESQNFEQVITQLQQMQEETRTAMQTAIRDQGLNPQRFSEILSLVREDDDLQEKAKDLIRDQVSDDN